MARSDLNKVKMPEQPPEICAANFSEVALGYNKEQAVEEAKRCLQCKNPHCVRGCPVEVNIPAFIKKITDDDVDGAYKIIRKTNSLPAVCGRVCPQEQQCEKLCVRAAKVDGNAESVAIGRLERFCADNASADNVNTTVKKGVKVAVIGSGPAGLTCAGDLAVMGYDAEIFEAFHTEGGVLVYGIPEFRLPKKIVRGEIENLKATGVKIHTNTVIGRTLSIDDLFNDGYKAVFIGSGAGIPNFLGIKGENANGVLSANEYLTRINLMKAYDDEYDTPVRRSNKVVVIGGGNVAMDAARCAKRLGASEVSIAYRRSENEMSARLEEVHHAKREGIEFLMLTAPVQINTDEKGSAKSVECVKMKLGEPDATGRRRPVEIEGSNFELECDTVIIAVGTSPNPILKQTTEGLETDSHGCITVGEDGISTSKRGVFAGGDAVTGAATVILAMGAGKKAAVKIDEYIKQLR